MYHIINFSIFSYIEATLSNCGKILLKFIILLINLKKLMIPKRNGVGYSDINIGCCSFIYKWRQKNKLK